MQINKQDWDEICESLGATPGTSVHMLKTYASNAGHAREGFNEVAQAVGLNSTCTASHIAQVAKSHRASATKLGALNDGLQHVIEHGRYVLRTRRVEDLPSMKYLLRLLSSVHEELG